MRSGAGGHASGTTSSVSPAVKKENNKAGPSRPRPRKSTGSPLTVSSKAEAEYEQAPSPPMETQFRSQGEDSDDQLWEAECILDERGPPVKGEYLVQWVGNDPSTGERWEPSWEARNGVTSDLAIEWKAKKKQDPSIVGVEGEKLAAAQKAKLDEERRRKARERKAKQKSMRKSTGRVSEVVDLTVSRSQSPTVSESSIRRKRLSEGPTEKESTVRNTSKKPEVVLPRKSRGSVVTSEFIDLDSENDNGDIAEGSKKGRSTNELPDKSPSPHSDPAYEDYAPEPPIMDQEEGEPEIDKDEDVGLAESDLQAGQSTKRPAAASPESESPVNDRHKRVRIDLVASDMNPSEAGPSKPAKLAKATSGEPDVVPTKDKETITKATSKKGTLKSDILSPVPVPSAAQFLALLPKNADSSQSTTSTGPCLSQVDPIQQFSSPLRDSLVKAKQAKARDALEKAAEVEKRSATPAVVKRVVDGEEVLGVETDSSNESAEVDDHEQEQDVVMTDADLVEETLAPVDLIMKFSPIAPARKRGQRSPENTVAETESEPASASEVPSSTVVEIVAAETTTTVLTEADAAPLAGVDAESIEKAPASTITSSPSKKADEIPSSSSQPLKHASNKTSSAMDRLDAAVASKGTGSSTRIPMPTRKAPRTNALKPTSSTSHVGAQERPSPAVKEPEEWTLRLSPAAKKTHEVQAAELVALRKMVAGLNVEKIKLEQKIAATSSTPRPPTKATKAKVTMADVALQTDPLPVVPDAVTVSMASQTDSIPLPAPAAVADMASQTNSIPTPAPVAVTDTAAQTNAIPVEPPVVVSDTAAQTDSVPEAPGVDVKALEEQIAAKDADRKKWRSRAKRAESEVTSLTEDLQFIREQYTQASESAVREVAKADELEAKVATLQEQLKLGLKQRELHNDAVSRKQGKELAILRAKNKILLDQSRRTDDEVRRKAAAYPELESQSEHLEQLLRNAMKKIDELSNRNNQLLGQVELLTATQMGLVVDSSDNEDGSYEDESSAATSESSGSSRRSTQSPIKRSSQPSSALAAAVSADPSGPSRKRQSPILESTSAPVVMPDSPTASQLMPDTQDLVSAENSLESSAGKQGLSDPQERSGEAYPSPWTEGTFLPNESAVKEHLMNEVDQGFS